MSKSSLKSIAKITAATLALGFVLPTSFAQEAASTADATELKQPTAKEGEGLDSEITNARMRADSGSRSKLSMSSSLSYSGGSVESPFSSERPNLDGDPSVETATDLGGSISARFRFNPRTSATFGAGVSVLKPFHGAEDLNIDNPGVSVSHVRKLGIFQSASSVGLTYGTSDSWKRQKQNSSISLSQNLMAQIGKSDFTAGASIGLTKRNYDNDAFDGAIGATLGLYPQLEYSISDRLVARTVFGYFNYYTQRNTAATDFTSFKNSKDGNYMYQSIGLGIVATRDIYIYPNLQFLPNDFGLDKTNVAVSATINLF